MPLPSAVQWLWYGDKGWVAYDKKVSDSLEEEYSDKKTKKIKVDKERFVDVDFKDIAEIKKQFVGLDKEAELVGVQRRYDDELKRRAVKRTVPDFFSKETIVVLLPKKKKEIFEKAIALYSGLVQQKVGKKVSCVVSEEEFLPDYEDEYEQAQGFDIPVVSSEFIEESVKAAKMQPFKDHKIKLKKRKKDSEDDEEPATKKKKKKEDSDDENIEHGMEDNTEWKGVCSYKLLKEKYSFNMKVEEVKGSSGKEKVKGTVEWPSLNGAKTKFKGEFNGKLFKFEEYEALKGKDEIQLPNKYRGKVTSKGKIEGKLEIEDEGEEATFTLELEKKENKFDVFEEDVKYSGECYQVFPFSLTINSKKEGKVSGNIHWPSFKTKTKFKGKIENDVLTFEETDVVEGDGVEVPVQYEGKVNISDSKVEGNFGPNISKSQLTGTFKLNFKKK